MSGLIQGYMGIAASFGIEIEMMNATLTLDRAQTLRAGAARENVTGVIQRLQTEFLSAGFLPLDDF